MLTHPALAEFPWTEAILERADPMNNGLVSIVAFDAEGRPRPAGSGFLIGAEGDTAIGVTAAHVFDEIAIFQGKRRHHNEALIPAPFRRANELDLRPAKLMACTFVDEPVPTYVGCEFREVAWDSASEVAYFRLRLHVPNGARPRSCLVRRRPSITERMEIGEDGWRSSNHHGRCWA